eukprot:scaffold3156_cov268-Chaetoceros_neogracile.AAC.51
MSRVQHYIEKTAETDELYFNTISFILQFAKDDDNSERHYDFSLFTSIPTLSPAAIFNFHIIISLRGC